MIKFDKTFIVMSRIEYVKSQIIILEKEIESGCEYNHTFGMRYEKGKALDEEQFKGRKYQLKIYEAELEKLEPSPF